MGKIITIFGEVDAIERPEPIDNRVYQLTRKDLLPAGEAKPAPPDVLIAREAVARVEAEDGWNGLAANRLHGAYDYDMETRIALATMSLLRERGMLLEQGPAA